MEYFKLMVQNQFFFLQVNYVQALICSIFLFFLAEENHKYAGELLYHAKELMDFAVRCPGTYNSCDAAGCYYK